MPDEIKYSYHHGDDSSRIVHYKLEVFSEMQRNPDADIESLVAQMIADRKITRSDGERILNEWSKSFSGGREGQKESLKKKLQKDMREAPHIDFQPIVKKIINKGWFTRREIDEIIADVGKAVRDEKTDFLDESELDQIRRIVSDQRNIPISEADKFINKTDKKNLHKLVSELNALQEAKDQAELSMESKRRAAEKEFNRRVANGELGKPGMTKEEALSRLKQIRQKEAKEVAIEHMKGCIGLYPHLKIEKKLADLVIGNILSETEARDILAYQKLKKDDREHVNRRQGDNGESSAAFGEVCEKLTTRWHQEIRDAHAHLAAKSKLRLWLEEGIHDGGHIKDFFMLFFMLLILSLVNAGVIWYVINGFGMQDIAWIFVVGGTVIFFMYLLDMSRNNLLREIELVRSDFDKKLLIHRASTKFRVDKVIIIFILIAFFLSAIRGCPEPIPLDMFDY